MKNAEGLVGLFSAIAMVLLGLSLVGFLGTSSGLSIAMQPIVHGAIILGAILALIFVMLIATQEDVSPGVVYLIFLFVGLCGHLIYAWFAPLTMLPAGLSLGFGLLFLFSIMIVMVLTVSSPNYIVISSGRPSASWARIVSSMTGQQYAQAQENAFMQRSIARRVERADHSAEMRELRTQADIYETKHELKDEISRQMEEVKEEEQEAKRELKAEISRKVEEVKEEEQESKREIKQEIKQVKDEVKKALENKEPTFFVASKTGKSLHKKNCIVLANIPRKNRVTFDSEKIAVKQGYKLCRVCFPSGKA